MGQQKQKVAFVTGITGQIGSYLAEYLLSSSEWPHGEDSAYSKIHGLIRPSSDVVASRERIKCFASNPRVELHYGDLLDPSTLSKLLRQVRPDEIYNLASQSHVAVSFHLPAATAQATGLGALNMLEAMRHECPDARMYQASSSEMFGGSPPPQSETTPFRPRSPYACAKVFAFHAAVNYREAYGLHVSNGILFNSESPRRGPGFVTRKITRGVARIALGKDRVLRLGNLEARRDWMHAKDAVRAMHLMLQQEKPDDYVLATGRAWTVGQFVREAAGVVGRTVAVCKSEAAANALADANDLTAAGGTIPIIVDARYFRPTEVDHLQGDASKAARVLGWRPTITLEQLVKEMVEADLEREAGRAG